MGNLHLVTGYAGEAHITAEDHGSFNAALTNGGNYVLNRGNKFSASIINNSTVRVLDGDLLIQGRHVRLPESDFVNLTIETGIQAMYRNDLIVARYTKNSNTGIEECNLVVIKGVATASNPTDPAFTSGDLLSNHDALVDVPLYRVRLNGLTPEAVEQLFEVITFVTVGADGKINNSFLPAMNFVPLSQKGKASGVASLDSKGKIPEAQIPELEYVSTKKVGAAAGVASLDADGKVPKAQIPDMNCIKNDKIGVAGGVVPLGENMKIDKSFIPPSDYDMTSGSIPFNYSATTYSSDYKNTYNTTATGTFKYTKIGQIVIAEVETHVVNTDPNPSGSFAVTLDGIPKGRANGEGCDLRDAQLSVSYPTGSPYQLQNDGVSAWGQLYYLTT